MKNIKAIIRLSLCLSVLLCHACSSSSADMDYELQAAETAVSRGDMRAASTVAERLSDDKNISGLSAGQLARLSIIYMQIADSIDNDTNVSVATALFRKAYEADPDSAAAYYAALPSDKAQYSMMLSSIVGNQDNPYDIDADSVSVNL